MKTTDLRVKRIYLTQDGMLLYIERIFGRGPNRRVQYHHVNAPAWVEWKPIRSFADRVVKDATDDSPIDE